MQFIPSKVDFSPESEKLWQGNLGMVAYEDNVVFTKASLIQFLKLHDVYVDPNGTELKKLPKFAQFGRLAASDSQKSPEDRVAPAQTAAAATPCQAEPKRAAAQPEAPRASEVILPNGEVFRPTRKVRELPGGGSSQIASLFGGDEEDEDVNPPAKPAAISNPVQEPKASTAPSPSPPMANPSREAPSVQQEQQNTFRPTRKVRELPGGGSSQISALFGGGDD